MRAPGERRGKRCADAAGFSAHNGRIHTARPKLVAQGCVKRAKKRKAKRRGHRRVAKASALARSARAVR